MIVIVCGSRSIDDYDTVAHAIERTRWEPDLIVHGDASGVDRSSGKWAADNGVDTREFQIGDYALGTEDTQAGPRRNRAMAKWAAKQDAEVGCIAVWDGESDGTQDMIEVARRYGFKVSVYEPFKDEKQEGLFDG